MEGGLVHRLWARLTLARSAGMRSGGKVLIVAAALVSAAVAAWLARRVPEPHEEGLRIDYRAAELAEI
jgi:hypothetical protein